MYLKKLDVKHISRHFFFSCLYRLMSKVVAYKKHYSFNLNKHLSFKYKILNVHNQLQPNYRHLSKVKSFILLLNPNTSKKFQFITISKDKKQKYIKVNNGRCVNLEIWMWNSSRSNKSLVQVFGPTDKCTQSQIHDWVTQHPWVIIVDCTSTCDDRIQ